MNKPTKIIIGVGLLVIAAVVFYIRAKPYIFPPQPPPGALTPGGPMMGMPPVMPTPKEPPQQ